MLQNHVDNHTIRVIYSTTEFTLTDCSITVYRFKDAYKNYILLSWVIPEILSSGFQNNCNPASGQIKGSVKEGADSSSRFLKQGV